jgi:hypothetical protein
MEDGAYSSLMQDGPTVHTVNYSMNVLNEVSEVTDCGLQVLQT